MAAARKRELTATRRRRQTSPLTDHAAGEADHLDLTSFCRQGYVLCPVLLKKDCSTAGMAVNVEVQLIESRGNDAKRAGFSFYIHPGPRLGFQQLRAMRNQILVAPEDVMFGHGIRLSGNAGVFDE